MKTISDYRKMIIGALRRAGKDAKALDLQVTTLASALRTLELTDHEIDTLESVVVMERTRYGEKMAPHPVFKVHKDAADSVTRQMKALGLNAAQLTYNNEKDPLVELTKAVRDADRREEAPVKPHA